MGHAAQTYPELFGCTLFGLPHTPREGDQQDLGQFGHFPAEDREVPTVDHEEAGRRVGDDGGRAGASIQQAHLAEECSGPQGYWPSRRHVDAHSSVEDEEELVSGIAHTGKHGAGRGVENSSDLGDAPELLLAASFKNRDSLELNLALVLDLWIPTRRVLIDSWDHKRSSRPSSG